MLAEDDITSRARDYESAQIAFGRVGWDGVDAHVDEGDPNGPDGYRHALVRVTLEGSEGVRGHRLICSVNCLSGRRIPQKGARVLVAIPFEMAEVPGAPMIIGATESDRRDNLSNGEMSIGASEGAGRVVVRNDGTVSLITTIDNDPTGKVVVFSISPTGLRFTSPWGSIVLDATGFHVRTKAGPRIDMGGVRIPGLPDELSGLLSAYARVTAPVIKLDGASVLLGCGDRHNAARHGEIDPTAPPPGPAQTPGLQSQTVWIAP